MPTYERKMKPLKWYKVREGGEEHYLLVRGTIDVGRTLSVPIRYYPSTGYSGSVVARSEKMYFGKEDVAHITQVPDKFVNELVLRIVRCI